MRKKQLENGWVLTAVKHPGLKKWHYNLWSTDPMSPSRKHLGQGWDANELVEAAAERAGIAAPKPQSQATAGSEAEAG